MANNITVKDGLGANQVITTIQTAGVHTPGHNVLSVPADPFGAIADAAVTGDNPGSLSAKLRGMLKVLGLSLPASLGQKVMASSLPVTFASDQTVLPVGGLTASEAHIGQITKPFAVTVPSLVVTQSSPYAQGACVGGVLSLLNCARVASGTGRIISTILTDASLGALAAAYTLLFFDANPTNSTFVDGTQADLNPLDFGKLLGSIDLVDFISIGAGISPTSANCFCRTSSDIPFVLPSGSTIYGVLIIKDTSLSPTYNSTTSLSMRMWVDQN